MTEQPLLIDVPGIVRELGVTKATAEAIVRKLEKVELPVEGRTGRRLRKVYVKRVDVLRMIEESTRAA